MSDTYGIPDIRDASGDFKDVDHSFEWNGQEVIIKHIPLTAPEQQRIEDQGEDLDMEFMANILDEKMVEPAPPDGDWALAELTCYFEGIVDFASGGGNEMMAQARQELERRAAEQQGN